MDQDHLPSTTQVSCGPTSMAQSPGDVQVLEMMMVMEEGPRMAVENWRLSFLHCSSKNIPDEGADMLWNIYIWRYFLIALR